MKTLIKDVLLYDGLGGKPIEADILINNGLFEAVGKDIPQTDAYVIQARGLAAAPGFIDVHSHSDASILAAPEAFGKISQGVTTEIVGNCGLSVFPANDAVREHLNALYASYNVRVTWSDLTSYAKEIERRTPAVNIGSLCGHNTLRGNAIGYHDIPLPTDGTAKMKRLLAEALSQGAFGISTGLLYVPGKFAATDELLDVMSVLKGTSAVYATHMRNEGDTILEALDEAIALARAGSRILEISHLKTAFERNWNKIDTIIWKIESAQKEGLRVSADRYPYTYGQTSLSVILPAPYDSLPDAEIQKILGASEQEKTKVRAELEKQDFWKGIILTGSNLSEYSDLFGLHMPEAAAKARMTCAELTVELTSRDATGAMAAFGGLSEDNMKKIINLPYVCCGSDENARPADYSIGRSHPRGFGSFPKFINIVKKASTLEEAIRKTTSLPAQIFGISGRGAIKKGMHADIVIFDPDSFADASDFAAPHKPAQGVSFVFVNGVMSYEPGEKIKRAGHFILKGRD